jgi:hypothetical protein
MVLPAIVVATLAACANSDSSSDQERRGTFYGGVSGGLSRP